MIPVNIVSHVDPPSHEDEKRAITERAPRTNLMLTAAIEAGPLNLSVRIRNLSESGALLEGAAFPEVGERLTLRRLDLEIGATVIWREGSRCGVKFEGKTSVAEWKSGTLSASGSCRDQSHVDRIQAAVRAGLPIAAPTGPTSTGRNDLGNLDARLAEELAHVSRILENLGDELIDEPIIVQRHPKALQSFDLTRQILGHLTSILTAENRSAAIEAIGMEDLRARLLRKPI